MAWVPSVSQTDYIEIPTLSIRVADVGARIRSRPSAAVRAARPARRVPKSVGVHMRRLGRARHTPVPAREPSPAACAAAAVLLRASLLRVASPSPLPRLLQGTLSQSARSGARSGSGAARVTADSRRQRARSRQVVPIAAHACACRRHAACCAADPCPYAGDGSCDVPKHCEDGGSGVCQLHFRLVVVVPTVTPTQRCSLIPAARR